MGRYDHLIIPAHFGFGSGLRLISRNSHCSTKPQWPTSRKRLFAEYQKERTAISKEVLVECKEQSGANAETPGRIEYFYMACILRLMAFYGRYG